MIIIKDGLKYEVEPIEEVEQTDGQWGIWSCDIFDSNDIESKGSIEGDGRSWAHETLEFD